MLPALRAALVALVEWSRAAGPAGPAAFAALYCGCALLLLPTWPLTLAAGLLWGTWGGLLVAWPSGTLGATLAFLAGRRLLRGPVARRIARSPLLAAVDAAVEREGLRIVLLARLSPFFPYNLLNYALSLTRLRLREFLLASVGSLPLALLHVQMGVAAGSAARLTAAAPAFSGPAGQVALWGGLAASALAVLLIARAARRALAASLGGANRPNPSGEAR